MVLGNYINIYSSGNVQVSECYLDATQQKEYRYTLYSSDGIILMNNGENDKIVADDREAIGTANFSELNRTIDS